MKVLKTVKCLTSLVVCLLSPISGQLKCTYTISMTELSHTE